METSDAVNELATALAKAQIEIKGATKDSVNPHFKSKYADLASVWDACHGPLNRAGIAIVQGTSADQAAVSVTTTLLHASGQWLRSTLTMVARDASPQSIGSCITYGRRYGLAAMVGVAPEDDDGQAATHGHSQGYTVEPAAPSVPFPKPLGGSTYATAQAPPPLSPADVPQDGKLRIMRIDAAPTKNKNVTKYRITLSTGEVVSTINQRLAALCEQLCQDRAPVTVDTEDTRYGVDLKGVHRADDGLPEIQVNGDIDTEPVDLDSIPFGLVLAVLTFGSLLA